METGNIKLWTVTTHTNIISEQCHLWQCCNITWLSFTQKVFLRPGYFSFYTKMVPPQVLESDFVSIELHTRKVKFCSPDETGQGMELMRQCKWVVDTASVKASHALSFIYVLRTSILQSNRLGLLGDNSDSWQGSKKGVSYVARLILAKVLALPG